MAAMFEEAAIDIRGGQMVWKYVSQFGEMTFRFDTTGGLVNAEGFADGAFGHAWEFTQAITEIASWAAGN